ncbi:glycosyltransferase [Nocardia sp. NPDC058058]|uniref:glycosyltransferase n=1 Tax=Nocardia sp. NPDC058058 TaxID=3346317 RepID=UPI0036DED4DB
MKVLLAFAGSRGDAQPGALLGRELAARGHRVTVAVSPNLVEFVSGHGVSAVPIGVDSSELLRAQQRDERFSSWSPVARVRAVVDLQRRGFAEAARDLLAIAGDADVLVTGMACEELAAEVARSRGIPLAAMHFFPIRPNRSVPVVPASWASRLPGSAHRLGWQALTKARAWALAREIAALRADLSHAARLAAAGRTDRPATDDRPAARGHSAAGLGDTPDFLSYTAIQAYDVELFPGLAEELGDAPVTGFPVVPGRSPAAETSAVDSPEPLSPLLARWLRAGEPPVYAGFGSMPVADPDSVRQLVREVGRRANRRVLLTGSMFEPELTPELAVLPQVDHRAVLPRCAVAIHHGGAGTTAAALRAGVPSVICSVQADQPFWGRQLTALGLGATLPFTELSADRLEQALIRATEPTVQLRASAYGLRFRDDGVARAADVIESLSTEATDSLSAEAAESVAPQDNSVPSRTSPAELPDGAAVLRIGDVR